MKFVLAIALVAALLVPNAVSAAPTEPPAPTYPAVFLPYIGWTGTEAIAHLSSCDANGNPIVLNDALVTFQFGNGKMVPSGTDKTGTAREIGPIVQTVTVYEYFGVTDTQYVYNSKAEFFLDFCGLKP